MLQQEMREASPEPNTSGVRHSRYRGFVVFNDIMRVWELTNTRGRL